VTWEDGWPVFNGGNPISEHIEGVLKDKSPVAVYLNDFTSRTLDLTFYFLRTPYKTFHSLTARPGFLRLNANSFALGDRDNPALILRKQTSYEETFETQLDFTPRSNLTEAGVTIFYSDLLHNDIGITGDGNGGRRIVTRMSVQAVQVGPWALTYTNSTITTARKIFNISLLQLMYNQVVYLPLTTTTGPVRFKIIGNSTSYSLGYAEGNSVDFVFPLVIDSVLLSVPPVGYANPIQCALWQYPHVYCRGFFFKGAAFGMYNTGNGKPSLAPADFEYWKQTPVF
jgi:hypothetical protein